MCFSPTATGKWYCSTIVRWRAHFHIYAFAHLPWHTRVWYATVLLHRASEVCVCLPWYFSMLSFVPQHSRVELQFHSSRSSMIWKMDNDWRTSLQQMSSPSNEPFNEFFRSTSAGVPNTRYPLRIVVFMTCIPTNHTRCSSVKCMINEVGLHRTFGINTVFTWCWI